MELTNSKKAGQHTVTYNLTDSENVSVQFDQLKRHRDGRFNARVKVSRQLADKNVNLYQGSLNLMAGRSRSQLAKTLKERLPKDVLDFERFIEEACRLAVEGAETTAAAEQLELSEEVTAEPSFIIYPIVPERLPVVLYGPGGGGKTFFAMYFALLAQNGLSFLNRPIKKQNTLYLDWEVDRKEATRRFSWLGRQLQQETGGAIELPFYRKCLLPLADDISEIAAETEQHGIGLVIIDSAAMAAGGDISTAETTITFFNALRTICNPTEAASIVLTHVTKGERREDGKKRLPIGSIFFENLARITWELRTQEAEENALAVGFFSRKSNFDRKSPKFGLKMVFNENKATVTAISAEDIESEEFTLEKMALEMMAKGPMRIKTLADDLGATEGTIRNMLSRAKRKGKVTTPERGLWALAAYENEPIERYWDK